MSRQRFIYPEIWHSEQVMGLPIEARLLWVGIFSTADDSGRRNASPASLKASIFPLDPIRPETVRMWTRLVAEAGLVRLYRDKQGAVLLDIPNWPKYQNPKYKKQSRLEPYRPESGLTPGQFCPDPVRNSPEPAPTPVQIGTDMTPIGPSGVVGCGVEGRGGVGCGVEGSGIETPPLTFDVSVTGPSPELPAAQAPDVPGQTALPLASNPGPHVTFTASEETTSTEGFGSSDPDGKANDAPKEDDVDDHVVTLLTAGLVAIWEENGAGADFGQADTLRLYMRQHDKANPVHLLAHVHEIDQSKKIKYKMRALFDRLRGKKKIEPSDESKRWAAEKLNGGPAKEKGQPEHVTAAVAPAMIDTGRPKPAHPAVVKMFEDLTDGWPEDKLNEDGARDISSAMLALRPAFVIAHCRDINARGDLTPNWTDLRGRLGALERPPEKLFQEAGVDVDEATAAKA